MANHSRRSVETPSKAILKEKMVAARARLSESPAAADSKSVLVEASINTIFQNDETARKALTTNLKARSAAS